MPNVTERCHDSSPKHLFFAPGFLFEPLGWVMNWLKEAVQSEPDLLADIYSLTRQRVHLIGLALAHLDSIAQHEMAHLLLRGRARDILDGALGRRPRGLKRALNNLLPEVLSPEGYRRLVELLDDPVSFRFLAHATLVDDDDLAKLADIPVVLRSALIPFWEVLSGKVASGLQYLVARGVASSFDTLVHELTSCRQPQQLSAHIKKLIDALPLPTEMPPEQIGAAGRIDTSAEIRDLAERWSNCLEKSYLERINDGTCAVYLWDDPSAPAVCAVERHGRLGWFLSDVKGPMNKDIEPGLLSHIHQAFADVSIVEDRVAYSIRGLTELEGRERRRRRERP